MSRSIPSLAACLILAACSGNVFVVADGGTDDGGGLDGGSATCPSSPPADGGACSIEALQCEYGNAPQPYCDTVATCTAKTWHVVSPPKGGACLYSGKCPAAFKDVPVGQSCPDAYPSTCVYPEGGCQPFMGGPVPLDAGGAAHWSCDQPQNGCPTPRPRLGSFCHQEGLACSYSTCVLPTGTAVICQTGTWHEQQVACAQ
jgi:hypothetical protein